MHKNVRKQYVKPDDITAGQNIKMRREGGYRFSKSIHTNQNQN